MSSAEAETFLPDVSEEVFSIVKLITLSISQFCFVLNVSQDGKNQLGRRELRKGICTTLSSLLLSLNHL